MLVLMAAIWPCCLVRREVANYSGNSGHQYTEEMQVGMSVTQRFRAEHFVLKSVEYVLKFDAALPLKGEFLFELLDEEGNVLCSHKKPYNITPEYTYCDIQLNRFVVKNRVYQFRLTNLSVEENLPCLVYSGEEDMHAVNNCGMKWNGQDVEGEALTRYTWEVPLKLHTVMVYWGILGITGCILYEIAGLLSRKRIKKEWKA